MWAATLLAGRASVARGTRGAEPRRRGGSRSGCCWAWGSPAAAVFAVLPPTGSTDALDYARVRAGSSVLGHSPYVMTPYQLRRTGDPVGRDIPHDWERARDRLRAAGDRRAVGQRPAWAARPWPGSRFWLKLWGTIAFGAGWCSPSSGLLRSDPARRARAHLLWTAKPTAAVDPGRRRAPRAAGRCRWLPGAHGAAQNEGRPTSPGRSAGWPPDCWSGVAADIKITYLLFRPGGGLGGPGGPWPHGSPPRRVSCSCCCPRTWGSAPPRPRRWSPATTWPRWDNFYQLFVGSHGHYVPGQFLAVRAGVTSRSRR